MTTLTVVSPASKPALPTKSAPVPVPMLISAPPAVQTMFVNVHPAGTVSVTNFVPNSDAVNPNGALAVGTFSEWWYA